MERGVQRCIAKGVCVYDLNRKTLQAEEKASEKAISRELMWNS